MNIFTLLHTERGGKKTPIVSMEASHLVNTVNLFLNKMRKQIMDDLLAQKVGNYAPEDMSEKVRRTLRLKKLDQAAVDRAKEEIEETEAEYIEEALERMLPYIVVGVCRDDTREGIVKILQEVTGISNQIILQGMIKNANALGPGILNDDSLFINEMPEDGIDYFVT